jgi:uncharacterized membrane protein
MKRLYFTVFCLIGIISFWTIPYLESTDISYYGFHFSLLEVIGFYLMIYGFPVLAAITLSIVAIWIMRKLRAKNR